MVNRAVLVYLLWSTLCRFISDWHHLRRRCSSAFWRPWIRTSAYQDE